MIDEIIRNKEENISYRIDIIFASFSPRFNHVVSNAFEKNDEYIYIFMKLSFEKVRKT